MHMSLLYHSMGSNIYPDGGDELGEIYDKLLVDSSRH